MNKPPDTAFYIAAFPPNTQKLLSELRMIIKKAAPEAEEVISYAMPAYKLHGMLVFFAGYEHHIGFYPGPSGVAAFRSETSAYKVSKATIQFPLDGPLPAGLITRIVKFRVAENVEKAAKKKKQK